MVDPEKAQHSSVDPDQMECRAVDPDQLNHRSPLRQRMVIGSPRLQHRKLDLDQHQQRAVDQHPQIAVAPDQLHHKALEPDQLLRRKVIGSPKLQRRAVDSDHVKPVGVDPDHVQLRAVDPSQSPRRAVDPDHVQRKAVDPDHAQLRAVGPSQSPRRWVDPSQTHVRAVDPDHVHPKTESLAKTSKYFATRRLPDAAHRQRPGQVGVPSSSPAAVGQVPEQHTSALSVSSSGGVTRTKRVRDGLHQKRSPVRGRGGAYTSPSANGPSTKSPQRYAQHRVPGSLSCAVHVVFCCAICSLVPLWSLQALCRTSDGGTRHRLDGWVLLAQQASHAVHCTLRCFEHIILPACTVMH